MNPYSYRFDLLLKLLSHLHVLRERGNYASDFNEIFNVAQNSFLIS